MQPSLKVEIISPNQIIFSGFCHLAVVPSVAGDLGIMLGHEIVVTNLREGEIILFDEKNQEIQKLPIKSGFSKVQEDGSLLVLID
jgi:F0F1-type ATP synthase epsilon subunit